MCSPPPDHAFAQRWIDRREVRVAHRKRAIDGGFNPREFTVAAIAEPEARRFVLRHHYSGSYPAARLAVGLMRERATGAELVGAAVFSVPMNQRTVTKYTGLEDANQGAELGRFVLTDEVGFNAESWFLSRAIRVLSEEKPEIRAIVSYSDPVERVDCQGRLCKPGHIGTIYQGSNALYLGRATPRTLLLAPDGQVISARAVSKVRGEERGSAYVERRLVAAGCAPRRSAECPREWLSRVLPALRRMRHHGNLTYLFGVGSAEQRRLRQLHPAPLPYPKAG